MKRSEQIKLIGQALAYVAASDRFAFQKDIKAESIANADNFERSAGRYLMNYNWMKRILD